MGYFDTIAALRTLVTKLFVISMPMSRNPSPTESELAILHVLWEEGPSTVHEVRNALEREAGYTTVLKLLQIMFEKELVGREREGRAHRYHPLIEKEETQRSLLGEFTDRLFGGSTRRLIQRAITSEELDKEELDEIERLLESLKSKGDRS